MPLRFDIAAALVALLASLGCGSGDAPVGQTPKLECEAIGLAREAAEPLEWVKVGGLPAEFEGLLYAEVTIPGDTLTGYAFTGRGDEGAIFFQTPLRPDGGLEGGPVALSFTDASSICPPRAFVIEPLPAAPGTFSQVVEHLQAFVRAQASAFRVTPEQLRAASSDTLFPPLIPLWLAQTVIDHPDNPNSLRHVLAGEAPLLGGEASDLALTEALLAKAGVLDALPRFVQQVDSLASAPHANPTALRQLTLARTPPAPRRPTSPVRFASYQVSTRPVVARRVASFPSAVASDVIELSAEKLDWAMSLATDTDIATSGRAGEIFQAFMVSLGLGAAIPGFQKEFGAAGALAFAYWQTAQAAARLLPHEFVRLEYELHPASFLEDEPGPGRWENLRAVAVSKGYQLDRFILEALLQVAGTSAAGGLKPVFKGALPGTRLGEMADNLRLFAASGVVEKMIGATAGQGRPLKVGPHTFSADISDPEWHRVRIEGRAVQVVFGSQGREYAPKNAGSSRITIWTRWQHFGLTPPGRRQATIEVRPITVTLRPSRARVAPGDAVTFLAQVEDALDPSLEWEIEPAGDHVLIVAGDPAHAADVTVSSRPEHLPARVKAWSTADRSHLDHAPERSATALLLPTELRIEPAGACVRPGETQRFTVMYPEINAGGVVFSGGPDESGGRDVRWTASAGSISPAGSFTAPRRAGEVTITAVDRQDPSLRGEATVVVRRCQWTLTIIGGPRGGFYWGRAAVLGRTSTGPYIRLAPDDEASGCLTSLTTARALKMAGDPTSVPCVEITFGEVAEGTTGTFQAVARIVLPGEGPGTEYFSGSRGEPAYLKYEQAPFMYPTDNDVPLIVTAYEDGRMSGRLEGTFHTLVDLSNSLRWNSWRDAEVRVEFTAESR